MCAMLNSRRRIMSNNKIDPDAAAFIAKGITNAEQKKAVNYLCIALKKANLWGKMVAIYPFVGGTAALHAWNLRNLSAHNITWQTSQNDTIHNATGVTPNTSAANLNFNTDAIPDSASLSGRFHLSYYVSAGSVVNNVYSFAPGWVASIVCLEIGRLDGRLIFRAGGTNNRVRASTSIVTGLFVAGVEDRVASLTVNNTLLGMVYQNTYPQLDNISLQMNSRGGGLTAVNNNQYSFCSIGDALSDGEKTTLYNIVQQFQTMLGRAV
jgi:hypothetical protein